MKQNIFFKIREKKFLVKKCANNKNGSVNSEKVEKTKGSGWIDLNRLIDQKVQIWSQQDSS